MTEQEKMLKGMIYDSNDEELATMRAYAHRLCNRYNRTDENDKEREDILESLIPENNGVYLQGPIFFDYGEFTTFGKRCYANFNFTVLDCAPVTVGDDVFFGPNVCLATPVHPMLARERKMYEREDGVLTDREYAKPIVIESDCWIASNVTVCGGVTIGKGTVIGAGSVVTRDIPDGVFAAGNPCKVIRKLTDKDSIMNKKDLFE
ncbi:MAG: sugar O-acetyltransferase [Corallococcus sp.]|nr:sugar O-acetyltransferase [Bacillota bacterium]MCM1533945.1 sugar O-acetyltransferase [Corallococcus sp.]